MLSDEHYHGSGGRPHNILLQCPCAHGLCQVARAQRARPARPDGFAWVSDVPNPSSLLVCLEWRSGSAVLGMIFKEGSSDAAPPPSA